MIPLKQLNFLKYFLYFSLIVIIFSNKSFAEGNNNLLWKTSAGNSYSHRFFSGEQINKDNIKNLTKLWTFNSGSTAALQTVQSPPVFIGNQLLAVTLTELPFSGSTAPMAFSYKGCEAIVFTATGGRYVGYKKNRDSTVAYKLKDCEFN